MDDLEKVVKGFECCQDGFCNLCSYDNITDESCRQKLEDDALNLLKAQQPRVLTVGEIRSLSKCPVWRETKNSRQNLYQGWVLLYEIQKGMGITGERFGMAEPNGRVSWYKIDDYCKTWRCWNKRPTDEQRKAVTWDD